MMLPFSRYELKIFMNILSGAPPLTESLSGTVQSLRDHLAHLSKTMETLTANFSEIESNQKLQS